MAIPAGTFTRKQIVDRALRRAGNTALSAAPDFEAQLWLNQILYDLYSQFDWPFTRKTETINITADGFDLTALGEIFLRPASDTQLIVNSFDGNTTLRIVTEIDRRRFDVLNAQIVTPSTQAQIPDVCCYLYEQNKLGIWPSLSTTCQANLTYNFLPATIPIDTTGDATVPTFPWHDYLIQALFVATLEYEMDGRADTEGQKREGMLARIRNIASPSRVSDPTISLDPQLFGTPFRDDYNWWGWNWNR